MQNSDIRESKIGSRDAGRQKNVFNLAVVAALVIFQFVLLFFIYGYLGQYVTYWRALSVALSVFVVIYIVNKQDNPAYKLAWCVLVLLVPLVGGALYVMLAGNRTRVKFIKKAQKNHLDTFRYMKPDDVYQKEILELSQSASVQTRYISGYAGYPVYKNTSVKYFALGEDNYRDLIAELTKAKHFIFMEYFIIKQGELWDEVKEILIAKAKAGLDVRLIYDGLGCAMYVPKRFIKEMSGYGIRVVPFNPVAPVINMRQNNRDHRKITVIDGYVGFTGGINLADEYINRTHPFGHWKDTGVMLKGDAVWSLTLMFLQTWHMLTNENDDYPKYEPMRYKKTKSYTDGYIQPYGDTPVDDEIVGENIYLNMINRAKHYIYIMTPYLIVDNEMVTALTLAAKSGVDVRIIVPGVADKKLVYNVTQSYFPELIKGGVKIYRYTPGFIHAKTVVTDDKIGTVGTINFDYRSLYLHFECGVWMFNSGTLYEIKDDFMNTLGKCEEITEQMLAETGPIRRLARAVLRMIAPIL